MYGLARETHGATSADEFRLAAVQTLLDALSRIEHCAAQLDEVDIWWRPAEPLNAVGNLVLHLCGNLGQWVVSGVGGQPDQRDRPAEFSLREGIARSELLERLRHVVHEAARIIRDVTDADLLRTRRIQHWDVTGLAAIFHAVSHFESHAQEIVYITRWRLGDRYRFIGLPPGAH